MIQVRPKNALLYRVPRGNTWANEQHGPTAVSLLDEKRNGRAETARVALNGRQKNRQRTRRQSSEFINQKDCSDRIFSL